MTKQLTTEGWQLTDQQQAALKLGMVDIEKALQQLQMIQSYQRPDFARWIELRTAWAQSLQKSFEYFLNSPFIHSAYRFAAWIDQPASLLREIHDFVQLFDFVDTAQRRRENNMEEVLAETASTRIVQNEDGSLSPQAREDGRWTTYYYQDGYPVQVPNSETGRQECQAWTGLDTSLAECQ